MDAAKTVLMDQHKRIQGATLFLKQRNKNYPVFKGLNTVGRNKSAVIDIKDLSISQNQAIIVIVDDNQHYLSDLNSSNGTFLHGTKLIPFKLYELIHDADITFGNICGRYLKPSHVDTTIHLNMTETMDMTQNMTQNFYAATTQLMFDTTSNEHEFVRPRSRNNQTSVIPNNPNDDIHSVPTQPFQNLAVQSTSSNENTLEENIHEVATQVVIYPENIPVITDPMRIEESVVVSNIHDEPTQVVVLPESMKTTHNIQAENNIQPVSSQEAEPVAKEASKTIVSKKEHLVAVVTEVGSAAISNDLKSKSQIDSQITNIDGDEDYMENFKTQKVTSRNSLHSSQIPSTSKVGQSYEADDSFVNNSSGNNVIVEETMMYESIIEEDLNDNSNRSEDLLTMPEIGHEEDKNKIVESTSQNMLKKLSQRTDSSSPDIVKPKKKVPLKLMSDSETSQNMLEKLSQRTDSISPDIVKSKRNVHLKLISSSETENDETQDIGIRKKPIVRLNSDSETDCEDNVPDKCQFERKNVNTPEETPPTPTQNIKPVIISKKNNFHFDSDTDVEDEDNNEKSAPDKSTKSVEVSVNSDSDTDIEDDKPEENQRKNKMRNLNDTDCIPATQDAFAEAFKYKSNLEDNSGRQSSEESFKLGLTELMVDNEFIGVEIDEQKGIQKNELTANENVELGTKSITSPKGKSSEDKDESNNSLDGSKKKTDKIKLGMNIEENIYELATQTVEKNMNHSKPVNKLVKESVIEENLMDQSDDFILPTQELRFLNEDSLRTKKLQENSNTQCSVEKDTERPELSTNLYDLPTQIVCGTSEKKIMGQSEDFILATQKLPVVSEDEYMMPTQKITESESQFKVPSKKFTFKKKAVVLEDSMSNILNSDNDDVYMAATQKMNLSSHSNDQSDSKTNQKHDENQDDDAYIQPTQCINFGNKDLNASKEEDIYILATQHIECDTTANNISKGNNHNLELEDSFCLPTQVISNEDISNSQSEILGLTENIEMPPPPDVHRPTNPLSLVLNQNHTHGEEPYSNKRLNADQIGSPNQKRIKTTKLKQLKTKTDDVETLSQIEAFVNKPFDKSENKVKRGENSGMLEHKIEDKIGKEKKIKNPNETEKTIIKASANIKNIQDNAETLSQIEAFVKNPLENVQQISKSVKIRMKRIDPVDNADLGKSEKPLELNVANTLSTSSNNKNAENNLDKSKTLKNDTTNEKDEMENSTDFGKDQEIRSDIDQSFALLESKVSKVKRNSRMHAADLGQIIVVPLNRKSMAIAETSKIEEVENTLPSRKSRRITVSNVQQTKPKVAPRKSRKKSDSGISTCDIPSKKSRTSVQDTLTSAFDKRFSRHAGIAKINSDVSSDSSVASDNRITSKTSLDTGTANNKTDDNEETALSNRPPKQITKEISIKTINTNSTTSTKNAKRNSRRTRKVLETKSEDVENNNKEIVQQSKSSTLGDRTSAESSTSTESTPKVTGRSSRKTRTTEKLSTIIGDDFSNSPLSKNKIKADGRNKIEVNSKATNNLNEPSLKTETPSKGKQSTRDVLNSSSTEPSTPRHQKNAATLNLTSSAERAKRKQKHKVVFTMMDNPQLESSIRQIGGSVVDSVDSSTVLVTQQVKRSQKLLTAVGQGKPICSPDWIQASKQNHDFLDPWDFILIDKEAESKWNFSLKESLERARETKLLRNYAFQLMVTNAVDVLKGAIVSCGGKVVNRHPGKKLEGTFVLIATPEQKSKYSKLLKDHSDIKVVAPEAIFDGVLRQELRLARHLLT